MKRLLIALLLAGCTRGTWVVLDLDGALAPNRVDLSLALDGAMSSHSLGPSTLPTSVAIQLPHGGQFSVALSAYDGSGGLIAQGQASQLVGAGSTATLHVALGPASSDGGAPGALSANPGHVDFGTVIAGVGSQPISVEITNSGGARLAALAVTRNGESFTISSDSCSNNLLSPGASCVVVVRYAPIAPGMHQGTLAVSAATGESVAVALLGTAVSQGSLQVAPASHDFGAVALGSQSDDVSFTVTNSGGATQALTTAITGGDATSFQVTGDGCSGQTLAPAWVCTVSVRFTPAAHGSRAATLTVGDGASALGLASLGGSGQAPGTLHLDAPGGLDFGSMLVGTRSATLTVNAGNSGDLPLGPLAVTWPAGAISLDSDGCSGQTLAGGGQCALQFSFSPTTVGVVSRLLSLSAPGVAAATATLSGAGVALGMPTVSPTSWDFGAVLGPSAPPSVQSFTVSNGGNQPAAAISVVLDGDAEGNWALVGDGCSGVKLGPGATCSVGVQLWPRSFGAKSTTLHLAGSDVPLSGSLLVDVLVAITVNGKGAGSVTSSAGGSVGGGIDCGARCNAHYNVTSASQTVTFTALPNLGSQVTGWSAASCGTASTCTVPVQQATAMTLSLGLQPITLDLNLTSLAGATGNVTVGGATINSNSQLTFGYGTQVTLTANPTAPGYFGGWSGDCTGFALTCTLTLTAPRSVSAAFSPANKIFITSTSYAAAAIGSLSNADALCHARAQAAGLSGNFVAVLSTSTVNARDRLANARGWVRSDGLVVRDTAPTATDCEAFYVVSADENGNELGAVNAWTGGDSYGAYIANYSCADWTSSDNMKAAWAAATTSSNTWLSSVGLPCSGSAHLYCAQVDYQVLVEPPVQPARYAFISSVGLNSQGRDWADSSCQTDATKAALPGTYHAFLAGLGSSAASRFNPSGLPWKRMDGVLLGRAAADFLDGNLIASLDFTAAGTLAQWGIWLGAPDAQTAGTAATTCNDWSVSTSAGTADYLGQNQTRFQGNSAGCALTFSVYCLQD